MEKVKVHLHGATNRILPPPQRCASQPGPAYSLGRSPRTLACSCTVKSNQVIFYVMDDKRMHGIMMLKR